ncbi:hypothetical protein QFZ23_003820 [Arthrobacter globiformis]|nr:hypothetical protein [Arthrobacter globiformis]
MTSNEKTSVGQRNHSFRPGGRTRQGRPRFMRYVWVALSVICAMTVAASAWLAVKAFDMSRQLETARQLMPQLKEQVLKEDTVAAGKTVEQLRNATSRAHEAGTDPIWTLAGALPWLGANFQAASALATSADDMTVFGAVPLVEALDSLNWKALAPNGGKIDLSPLSDAAPRLQTASQTVIQSADRLAEVNTDQLLPQVAEPLRQAKEQLDSLQGELSTAADAASVAPGMMGAEAPRKYLLLIQNNAESRASGGIPGALAVLQIDNGKMSLTDQTSATDLGAMSPIIGVEAEQQQIYSRRVGKFMQDVNLTPDFPTSASAALAMWQQKTGTRLDGVVSIDPVALSYLLAATGPVKLTDTGSSEIFAALPTELSAKNVVKTLLSDVYAEIPDPAMQDLYFANVAKELFHSLSNGKADSARLLDSVTSGVKEGRVMAWSAAKEEQTVISKYPLSGSLSGPYLSPAQFGLYFNDGTGAKMDYYVKRTAQLIPQCSDDGYIQMKLRVTSTNTAPTNAASALPAYVTGGGVFGVPAGSVQTNIIAYGPAQSNVEEVFAGGKKIAFASYRHAGRPVGVITVRLAPGQSSTAEFTFGKIVQHTAPQLSVTPTVQAQKDVVLATQAAACVPAS